MLPNSKTKLVEWILDPERDLEFVVASFLDFC